MSDAIKVSAIVAMAQNRTIGINNALPWYLPNDLKYFKAATMGKPIIMGRKTFESIGRPLPGRSNIVMTKGDFSADGVTVVHSVAEALQVAEGAALVNGVNELMVIGGAAIYELFLSLLDRLYLTEVMANVDGDAWFPAFDRTQWREVASDFYAAEGPNPYDYRFVVLEHN